MRAAKAREAERVALLAALDGRHVTRRARRRAGARPRPTCCRPAATSSPPIRAPCRRRPPSTSARPPPRKFCAATCRIMATGRARWSSTFGAAPRCAPAARRSRKGLALMGCRPQWDAATGRVTGIEVLPPATVGRPRVDVTWRISGLFRDMFPTQIALIDAAAARRRRLRRGCRRQSAGRCGSRWRQGPCPHLRLVARHLWRRGRGPSGARQLGGARGDRPGLSRGGFACLWRRRRRRRGRARRIRRPHRRGRPARPHRRRPEPRHSRRFGRCRLHRRLFRRPCRPRRQRRRDRARHDRPGAPAAALGDGSRHPRRQGARHQSALHRGPDAARAARRLGIRRDGRPADRFRRNHQRHSRRADRGGARRLCRRREGARVHDPRKPRRRPRSSPSGWLRRGGAACGTRCAIPSTTISPR